MSLPTLHEVNILGTCLGVFATLVTFWRLWYRWRDHKFWWDDAWAAFAMFNAWILVACVWVIFAPEDSSVTQHSRVITFYLLEVCFTFALWASRLSILFTIIRITPGRKTRKILHTITTVFAVFAVILAAQKFWVCVPQPGWTDVPGATCNLGRQVAFSEIVTDVFGDIILVAVPVKLLWNIKVSKALRIRLITVFSMSLVTTIVSLCQNYYLIHDGGIKDFIVSHVEIETAVTICNLNVIVAALYRILHKAELEETNDSETKGGGGGTTFGTPSHVSFAAASRIGRVRSLPSGHPSVLGPPLAVAVGGITTGGQGHTGSGSNSFGFSDQGRFVRMEDGIRIHTTVHYTSSKDNDSYSFRLSRHHNDDSHLDLDSSLKDLPSSLEMESSEDGDSYLETPPPNSSAKKEVLSVSFDTDLERGQTRDEDRGEDIPMKNLSKSSS